MGYSFNLGPTNRVLQIKGTKGCGVFKFHCRLFCSSFLLVSPQSRLFFIMSVVVIAAVSAAINGQLREERERKERYKARENKEISTRRYRERAVEQRAAAAEREEKEARKRVEYEAQVKVERDAAEARESAAADERMNQHKNEEMAAAKSIKNQLKRLLQCWNCCS